MILEIIIGFIVILIFLLIPYMVGRLGYGIIGKKRGITEEILYGLAIILGVIIFVMVCWWLGNWILEIILNK